MSRGFNLLGKIFDGNKTRSSQKTSKAQKQQNRRRLVLETLEERALLAVDAGFAMSALAESASIQCAAATLNEAPIAETASEVQKLSVPTGVTFTQNVVGITVSWDAVEGANKYSVETARGTSNTSATQFTLAGLKVGTTYDFRIMASNSTGEREASDWTETFSVVYNDPEAIVGKDGLSLKEAICYAPSGARITFAPELSGVTIYATEINISRPVIIDASDLPDGIIIDGNSQLRVFNVSGGTAQNPVQFIGLTIQHGYDLLDKTGGIYAAGYLPLTNCVIRNCMSEFGGGIYNQGNMPLENCLVANNAAEYYGGGIVNRGTMSLKNVTVAQNSIMDYSEIAYGGGIHNSGTMVLYNSIVAQNTLKDIMGETIEDNICGTVSGYHNLSSGAKWKEGESFGNILYDAALPLFETGSFQLTEDSQAVNVGENDYVTSQTDLAGKTRIVAEIVDLGAYEFQGTKIPSVILSTQNPTAGTFLTVRLSSSPKKVAYQWFRIDASGNETALAGKTSARYKVTEADKGFRLKVVVKFDGQTDFAATSVVPLSTPKITLIKRKGESLAITWRAIPDANTYTLTYSTDEKFSTYETVTTSANTAQLDHLTLGATYYVKVQAFDSTETYLASAESTVKPIKLDKLGTPNITSIKTEGATITADWTLVTGANRYVIHYATNADFYGCKSKIINSATTSFATLTDLTMGEIYYVRVQARNIAKTYTSSDYSVRKITVNKLAAPEITTLTQEGTNVSIAWNAVENANRYIVMYSSSADFTTVSKKVVNGAVSATITGLTSGNTYYFKVQARDSSGKFLTSEDSDVRSLAIASLLPEDASPFNVEDFGVIGSELLDNEFLAIFGEKLED